MLRQQVVVVADEMGVIGNPDAAQNNLAVKTGSGTLARKKDLSV